ncbi:MAG: class I SAM-dependent RNA methyltransferase [Clostridia bacterium]|nr:class I SAM-dependent RNA methyltransferase [Clostridia bacterium]
MKLKLVATCLFGLEHILGEEIDALGYKRIATIDGRVTFEGDETAIAKCNLWLRTAERVFILLDTFHAATFNDLFEGTKALPWENFIPKNGEFPVKGHSIKSTLFSIPDCQKIIKKAVATKLSSVYKTDWLREDGAKYQIEFFILKDEASLMIDTSGTALHKRGYRPQNMPAPLRETLAAAMVKIARPREDVLLHDPFCGSGTIPIEAAMLMSNTAPGLSRSFAAEDFDFIPKEIWQNVREEARNAIKTDCTFEAYASDIDPEAVKNAELCVKKSGMTKYIKVYRADALQITTGDRRGTVVCNPPYGERLGTIKEAETLYKKMGKQFATLGAWQIYVLTSNESFEKLYGRRADKVRKLYNGMLPCYYYQFFKKPSSEQAIKYKK